MENKANLPVSAGGDGAVRSTHPTDRVLSRACCANKANSPRRRVGRGSNDSGPIVRDEPNFGSDRNHHGGTETTESMNAKQSQKTVVSRQLTVDSRTNKPNFEVSTGRPGPIVRNKPNFREDGSSSILRALRVSVVEISTKHIVPASVWFCERTCQSCILPV